MKFYVATLERKSQFLEFGMHGNVWEWCLDDWHKNYEAAPTDGSAWLDSENNNIYQKQGIAVLRGGSWSNIPVYCRCASRLIYNWAEPDCPTTSAAVLVFGLSARSGKLLGSLLYFISLALYSFSFVIKITFK